MKPLLLMRYTLAYILSEVESKNQIAIDLMANLNAMEIVEKEKYFVLTDKIIPDETS